MSIAALGHLGVPEFAGSATHDLANNPDDHHHDRNGHELPAMSKSEMKKQRQQQKHEEKAAKARAKAAKYQADAKKEQNKSVQESEKAAAPQ